MLECTSIFRSRWSVVFGTVVSSIALSFGLGALLAPVPAAAWTPQVQETLALEAARLAPPDLYRQIHRHRDWYLQGVRAPFESGDLARHVKNPDGSGQLDAVIQVEIATAIEAIRELRPFHQVVYRLGVVAHYVADANNPLNTSDADPREEDYFADYLFYVEDAEPRMPLVFYGLTPGVDGDRNGGAEGGRREDGDRRRRATGNAVDALVGTALERSRRLYPLVGREYRRIGFGDGRRLFDDKSTAFGVAAVSFSQAVTDIAQALRYIWIEAGGADERWLPERGERVVQLPRYDPERHVPPPALEELPLAPPPRPEGRKTP